MLKRYYCTRCHEKIGLLDKVVVHDKMIRLSNGKDLQLFKYKEMKHYDCLTYAEQKERELAGKKRKKKKDDKDYTPNGDYIRNS